MAAPGYRRARLASSLCSIHWDSSGSSFDDANAIMLRDGFAGIYPRAALPAMIDLLDGWRPDVVIREELEFASLVAAERRGIRHVQVATGLLSTQSYFRPQLSDAIDGLLREAGVAAERSTLQIDDPRLSLTPPSLELPDDRSRAERFRALDSAPPRSNPGRRLSSLRSAPKLLLRGSIRNLYRATIEALADDSVDVLVAVGLPGDPAAFEPLPKGVRVERWVDQAEVLPRAALVVSHGGCGTMIGALAAGTPLVVIPLFAADQWMNGGESPRLAPGWPSTERLTCRDCRRLSIVCSASRSSVGALRLLLRRSRLCHQQRMRLPRWRSSSVRGETAATSSHSPAFEQFALGV